MVLVKAVSRTLTAFSHGEFPVWANAGAASARPSGSEEKASVYSKKRKERRRKDSHERTSTLRSKMPSGRTARGGSSRSPGSRKGPRGDAGICCLRHVVPQTSGHNWSVSSRNSVVPRSRWHLTAVQSRCNPASRGTRLPPCSREYVARTPLAHHISRYCGKIAREKRICGVVETRKRFLRHRSRLGNCRALPSVTRERAFAVVGPCGLPPREMPGSNEPVPCELCN